MINNHNVSRKQNADEKLFDAYMCVKKLKFKNAEKIYLEIIQTGYNSTAILKLAGMYIKTARLDKCRDLLDEYDFKEVEDIISKKILLTKLELYEYNFERSYILCDEIFKFTDSNNVHATFYQAISHINLYNYEEAKQIFKKLSKSLFYAENSFLFLIKIEIIKGNYDKAIILANSFIPILDTTKRNLNYIKSFLSKILNKEYISSYDNYNTNIDESTDYDLLINHIAKHFDSTIGDDNLQFKDTKDRLDFIYELEEQKSMYYPSINKVFDHYIVELKDTIINSANVNNNYAKIFTSLNDRILTVHPIQVSKEFDAEGYGKIKKR